MGIYPAAQEVSADARGGTVIQQGDVSGTSMYILVEGLLEVYVDHEGNAMKVAQLKPGQFFGEMSLLAGEPRWATILTATDVVLFEITGSQSLTCSTDCPTCQKRSVTFMF